MKLTEANEKLGINTGWLKDTWVDGSWKQRADALEQENKWLGNENFQLKAQIKELIRNGRRDL